MERVYLSARESLLLSPVCDGTKSGNKEKQRHGAAPATAMTHIAEQLDSKAVDWMEHISDEPYQAQ